MARQYVVVGGYHDGARTTCEAPILTLHQLSTPILTCDPDTAPMRETIANHEYTRRVLPFQGRVLFYYAPSNMTDADAILHMFATYKRNK